MYTLEQTMQKIRARTSEPDKDGHTFYTPSLKTRFTITANGIHQGIARVIFTYNYNCINQIPTDFRVTRYCDKPGCVTHLDLRPPSQKRKWQHDPKLQIWTNTIKHRDNYRCQIPGCIILEKVLLHAHHLNPKKFFPEQAYDIDNGITLCYAHHKRLHSECKGKDIKSKFSKFQSTTCHLPTSDELDKIPPMGF